MTERQPLNPDYHITSLVPATDRNWCLCTLADRFSIHWNDRTVPLLPWPDRCAPGPCAFVLIIDSHTCVGALFHTKSCQHNSTPSTAINIQSALESICTLQCI